MLDTETQACSLLTAPRQRRFHWLVANRNHLARIIAEMCCFGIADVPALDRQLVLTEAAITALVSEPHLAAELSAEWAVRDAALIHRRDEPPAGFDCSVCRLGRYGIEEILARLPEPID